MFVKTTFLLRYIKLSFFVGLRFGEEMRENLPRQGRAVPEIILQGTRWSR